MANNEEDLVSLEELRSVLHAFSGSEQPHERPAGRRRLRRMRPVLVVGVTVAALAGTGVAVAAGLGAFNGISAAQGTQTGASVLPSAILAQVKEMNAQHASVSAAIPQLLPDTARVLGTMPDGSPVYGLSNTHGDLCVISEAGGGCGAPLSKSHPITMNMSAESPTTGGTFIASGVALDGVTSVSFTLAPGDGTVITVPVENNVYWYEKQDTHANYAHCVTAHFADGSTVNAFPGVPCP